MVLHARIYATPYNQPMFRKVYVHFIQPMGTFNRDARLFLWMTVINGIIISGWQLFFNIYMLESGFTAAVLGILHGTNAYQPAGYGKQRSQCGLADRLVGRTVYIWRGAGTLWIFSPVYYDHRFIFDRNRGHVELVP
jgi:hypothetical protein